MFRKKLSSNGNSCVFKHFSERAFPFRPSAVCHDAQLDLLGIGTKNGAVRIFGRASFQLSFVFEPNVAVDKLLFVEGLGRILVLTDDGDFHLLEINFFSNLRIDRLCTSAEENRSFHKQIRSICLLREQTSLLLGLNDGNIHRFDLECFQLEQKPLISVETIEKIIAQHSRRRSVRPTTVQSIVQHPENNGKIIIAYKNKIIVHWDLPSNSHDRVYIYNQDVESVCWYNDGTKFASSHSNGSFALWDCQQESNIVEKEIIPYGPSICSPMTKIIVKSTRTGHLLIIFSGALPRSNYANKHTVACCVQDSSSIRQKQSQQHVVFDFTSPLIDFFTLDRPSSIEQTKTNDIAHTLVVLLHEEIIFIDLNNEHWPLYRLPYLNSIHASPVISMHVVIDVHPEFYDKLLNFAKQQNPLITDRPWPINGGRLITTETIVKQQRLLLTGHEDGSVQFWDLTDVSMPFLYKMRTNEYFEYESISTDDTDQQKWPPFRSVSTFDPYCDDPRLAIQKLAICTATQTLIVAGTAGQILTFQMNKNLDAQDTFTTTVYLLEDCVHFVWKGHEELRRNQYPPSSSISPTSIIQLNPPGSVSTLSICSQLQLYAAATSYGFVLFNYERKRILFAKSTLNPYSLQTLSRLQSSTRFSTWKTSIRNSFRRFSQRRTIVDRENNDNNEKIHRNDNKSTQDQTMNMVRCIYFSRARVTKNSEPIWSWWIGTNCGHIYIYSIISSSSESSDLILTCSPVIRHIQLKHRAPLINIIFLNGQNQPLNETITGIDEPAQKVLLCSEEQVKILAVPSFKLLHKFKLSNLSSARFQQMTVEHNEEPIVIYIDNQGQLGILSLPNLRHRENIRAIEPTNSQALSSAQLCRIGRLFYLSTPSELSEWTLFLSKSPVYTMKLDYDQTRRKSIRRAEFPMCAAKDSCK